MKKSTKEDNMCPTGGHMLKDARAKEFLSCLGNGKTIYQLEAENDEIDEEMENRRKVHFKHRL